MARKSRSLAELVEAAKRLPPITPRELEEQSFSFAYGNLALTTNHRPMRDAFARMTRDRGWTEGEFEAWASEREWER